MQSDKSVPLVSVVIPVYKTEKYLEECIASVLGQDYPRIELILVDDGSPDRCPAICEYYAGKYKNIQTIHQKNQGLGMARNRGMESARGIYLLFLDSDDCLDGSRAVRRLVEQAEEEQADIVVGNFRRFDGRRISKINRHHMRSGSYTKTVDFRFKGFLTDNHLIADWGKLYRMSFLQQFDIKCSTYYFMEDKLHNMICCTYGPVYGFVHESVYLYRIRRGSITNKYKNNAEDMAKSWLYIGKSFYRFLEKRGVQDTYNDLLAFHLFCGIFSVGKQSLRCGRQRGRKTARLLKSYGKHPLVRKGVSDLAKGKYVNEVESVFWSTFVRMAAVLFCLGAYRTLTLGIAVLQGLGTEERTSRLKYKRTIHRDVKKRHDFSHYTNL